VIQEEIDSSPLSTSSGRAQLETIPPAFAHVAVETRDVAKRKANRHDASGDVARSRARSIADAPAHARFRDHDTNRDAGLKSLPGQAGGDRGVGIGALERRLAIFAERLVGWASRKKGLLWSGSRSRA